MQFWIQEFIHSFRPRKALKVGFILPEVGLYNSIMPSTRIRAMDVITAFRDHKHISAEVYRPFRKYDILIFQKKFDQSAYQIAQHHRNKSCKIVLDVNVNYYDLRSTKISQQQNQDIINFSTLCHGIICSSPHLTSYIQPLYPNIPVRTIEEAIPQKYFDQQKQPSQPRKTLIWSGFAVKADSILLIQDTLLELSQEIDIEIIIISEQNPHLSIGHIPIKYIPYNEHHISSTLLLGDIFIAPRSLNETYNLGHSFTKIGVAMALGIPCIASPIPSYTQSPSALCNTPDEWKNSLFTLLTSHSKYQELSAQGIAYCKQKYTTAHIKKQYETFFKTL